MKKVIGLFLFLFTCIIPLFAQEDAEGCKDPTLFTRMYGFHIYRCEDIQFNKYEFRISDSKTETVEGHRLYINY